MTTYVPHRNRRAYEQAPTRLSPPLRTEHDRLSGLAPTFSEDDLARPSGAAEWDISQVLSHLGSGTEIRRATPPAALGQGSKPERDDMEAIWATWNGMTRRQRANRPCGREPARALGLEACRRTTYHESPLAKLISFIRKAS
ncbi:hypothetical protein GCM10022224_055470 [Nonomuraea antimicrobica]|uniref:Mycothiol-dependent maleylpyruvate isomerase metal-binding domain-containing protein n=1 Tax=Nonomuraea antimicrobica TaxID=561173 RepID=A0ABP7C903_9ACTN